MTADQLNGGTTAPVSIAEQRETFIREDGSTYTRQDIYVKLAVTFRDNMLAKLKGPKLSVYLCIALHCNEAMTSFPSIKTIVQETDYSRTAVIKAIHELEAMNLITISSRQSDYGDLDSNLYQIQGYVSMGGGSTPSVPPVVHDVNQGSAPSVPKEEPIEEEPGGESAPPAHLTQSAPRNPAWEAGYVYKDETGEGLPSAYWVEQVVEAVGTEPDEVQRWRAVIRAWLGKGWRGDNVSGMLECFRERRLPGEDRQPRHRGQQGGASGTPVTPQTPRILVFEEPAWLTGTG